MSWGRYLASQLASGLIAAGLNPAEVQLSALLDPVAQATMTPAIQEVLQTIMASAIARIFFISFVASAIGLIATVMTPRGRINEMTRPDDKEPQNDNQSGLVALE